MLETATLTPLGHQILEHWKHHRPKMVGKLEQRESASSDDLRGSGIDGESPIRTGGSSEDGLPAGVGDRDEGMGVPPGRRRPTSTIVRSSEPRPAPTLTRDLRITGAHGIGDGSLKQKAQANLAAIRTLKAIEAEDREATPAEKAALVKYTGWGAMPNAFAPHPSREWQSVADELSELLTADEYASARASTPNAHYTSPEVVSGDLAGDGSIWTPAWRTHPRTVDGRWPLLWSDARKSACRHAAHWRRA